MSDWFNLPTTPGKFWLAPVERDNGDRRQGQMIALVQAINTHDAMQARIVELEKEVEKTVYVYSMVLDHATGGELSKAYFDHEMVCKAIDKHYQLNEDENIKEAVEIAVEDMTGRVVGLEGVLESIRSIVTDVQDGFDVTGSDAEILDLINET